jgi:hypothetical protein
MATYKISKTSYYTDSTPEFGYGDFGETRFRDLGTVEASTRREAMNKAKKTWRSERLKFSGIGGDSIIEIDANGRSIFSH